MSLLAGSSESLIIELYRNSEVSPLSYVSHGFTLTYEAMEDMHFPPPRRRYTQISVSSNTEEDQGALSASNYTELLITDSPFVDTKHTGWMKRYDTHLATEAHSLLCIIFPSPIDELVLDARLILYDGPGTLSPFLTQILSPRGNQGWQTPCRNACT